ncbi:hypothetical protein [Frankia sp. R82]|uniref:hypothetical protein n=1 Tax=Frankia sp. R82 TaxID=2950553 RepID=UPI002043B2DC|nr:hypothetical protein [Frankia sp. R82]MCM3886130.1 hypothetical protein [Frankia sp. R82]
MQMVRIAGACIALFLAASCGSGEDSRSTAEPTAPLSASHSPSPSQDDIAVRFVSGLTTTTLKGQQDTVPLTSPGSAARAYINYLVAFTDAETSAGHTLPAGRFTSQGKPGTLTECDNVPEDPHPCAEFSNFHLDGHGLISTFDIDGQPVRTVVAVGGPAQTASGVTVQPMGAYSDTGNATVVVAYKVTNETSGTVTMAYNAAEMVSGGSQHDTVGGTGPNTLPPSVSGMFLAQFSAQDPMGTFQVEADYQANGGGSLAHFTVKLISPA